MFAAGRARLNEEDGGPRMDSRDAEVRFREFAAGRGSMIENLSASEAVDMMAAFYREVRADDCDLDADGDMLLFEWGVYEGLDGETFMYDITRQLVPEPVGDEEPHDFIGQLSLAWSSRPRARSARSRTATAGATVPRSSTISSRSSRSARRLRPWRDSSPPGYRSSTRTSSRHPAVGRGADGEPS